jgi:hypothetical protein
MSETDPAQKARLAQAERSANRMLDMLTDILDFAALENAQYDIADKPFFSNELLLALPELLGPVAAQAEARLHVRAEGTLPIMLRGDATRLRRAYALMVTYFLETAGARDISLALAYESGILRARIEVDYVGDGWSPDLVFGTRKSHKDSFAVDALGPSVARVLVRKMAGEIDLGTSDSGKILLRIDVPVAALSPQRLKVGLAMQSAPMEMVCKSSLSSLPIEFVPADAAAEAELVLVEAASGDSAGQVNAIRAQNPSVLVFGIGHPQDPSIFDFVADLPLEAARLKNRVSEILG